MNCKFSGQQLHMYMCVCIVTIMLDVGIGGHYKSNIQLVVWCQIWCAFSLLLITSLMQILTFAILFCSNDLVCCLISHGCESLWGRCCVTSCALATASQRFAFYGHYKHYTAETVDRDPHHVSSTCSVTIRP